MVRRYLVVLGVAVFLVGCSTLCVGFCCMMIPVVGQTLLQPYYVFTRSFPLIFLRGFGPEFDAFASGAPGTLPPQEPWPSPPTSPGAPGPIPAPADPLSGAEGSGTAALRPEDMSFAPERPVGMRDADRPQEGSPETAQGGEPAAGADTKPEAPSGS